MCYSKSALFPPISTNCYENIPYIFVSLWQIGNVAQTFFWRERTSLLKTTKQGLLFHSYWWLKKLSSSYPYIFKYKGNERRQNYPQDDNAWFSNNFSRLKLSEMNNRVKKEWILNSLGVEELISTFLGR